MTEETTDKAQYDSDADFERPTDEFIFYHKAFKLEEKRMYQHQRFEEIAAKYWQLLRADASCDLSQQTISQAQYTELLKRIYKTLLPLYRESEMASEISQEWLMDCRGQNALTYQLFTKVLFRIAHWWAINIDIDEYIELLNKIFTRITTASVLVGGVSVQPLTRAIRVEFPQDEKKLVESEGRIDKNAQLDDWLECRSDESNKSDYEYKYEEDPDNMVVKKYKKNKNDLGAMGGAGASNMSIKEPFVYSETVQVPAEWGTQKPDSHMIYSLQPLQDVLPFGIAAERFICWVKNDIYETTEAQRLQNKKQQAAPGGAKGAQDSSKDGAQGQQEVDPGLLDESSPTTPQILYLPSEYTLGQPMEVSITPTLYNSFRRILKSGQSMNLRLHFQHPKPGRSRARTSLNSSDPISEANKFGYNPALERRISYKLMPSFDDSEAKPQFVNIHYLVSQPDHETAYRCDVTKVETKGQFSLKDPSDGAGKKDEEFVNVDTSYRKLREVMLAKKFETIFQERSAADTKEQKRLAKIIDKENKRKANLQKPGTLPQKGLSETYEEKTFVKMMKGPFYQLDSLEGLKEDRFAISAEQDLIEAANKPAHRVLIIGKPRSGKSTLAKSLAPKLDLVHINTENWISALLEKIKNYEPPEDLPEDADPLGYLSPLESTVYASLRSGSGPQDSDNIDILRQMINSPLARVKGYILDLDFYNRGQSWAATIRQEQLLGPYQNGKLVGFSHVIELQCDDEEVKERAREMRLNPEDNVVYSRWEREERKKPKPVSEDDDQDDDEENQIKPFKESDLIRRVNDAEDQVIQQVQYYNTVERPSMEELLINLFDSQYIKLDSAGLEPGELSECAECRLRPDSSLPLRPVGLQIEGCGDYKSILTEGIEEGQIPRKWSLWRQADPVDLTRGRVSQGLPEYAASYFNNAFVFSNEDNLKVFLEEPKTYLQQPPSMPTIFRTLMLGPTATGKHTQAQLLSDLYGWKIVDYKQLVQEKLEELLKLEIHIPNNPVPGGRIAMSELELQEIVDGKPMPAWKFIPWIFEYLGYELEKKRPPPPEAKDGEDDAPLDDDDDDERKKKKELDAKKKREEEDKKKKEEEELQRQRDERRKRRQEAIEQGLDLVELGLENEEEEIIIIEDLSIDQLALKIDEASGRAPFVGGFILIGFPESEEHINKLKEHGIEFDRILYLADTNEEEPGAEVKARAAEIELYDYDAEVEAASKILALAREHLNEEVVREISCNGSPAEVLIRIRNEIDPFYLKVDVPDDVRVTADLGDEDRRLPKGDFGDYCPVTFVSDNWLVKGNPDNELTVFGKTFWFAGEKEAELFKFNPSKYLTTKNGSSDLPLEPPPPKIMVVGTKGAGVTTQIRALCDKYRLDEFVLKDEYLAKLKEEKEKRKRRRLLDRGFRPPLPAEEEGAEPPPDPEIEEDPSDTFDKEAHERELMQLIFDYKKGLVIDGTWTDFPEDTVGQTLQDLLVESRRLPEILIVLKCKEANAFKRMIKYDQIKADYDQLMEERTQRIAKEREEARRQRLEELQADEDKTPEDIEREMAEWEDARDEQEAANEDDPDKPNYDEMLEKEKEALKERRDRDEQFIEEFSTALRDKGVLVVDDVKADVSAEYVFIKLLDKIKDNFAHRRDLVEKQQAQSLRLDEVPFYEKSYIYSHSKFGVNSPLQLGNPTKTKQHAVLYRERIYFPSSPEQQQQFLKEPSKWSSADTIPLDIAIKPKLAVIGYPKSGKSTLCKRLAYTTGLVHLKPSKIIQEFMDKDSLQSQTLRRLLKAEGRSIEDDMLINLIMKRLQYKDCQTKGWVLDDFPKTRAQAVHLARKGLVPSNVFYLRSSPGAAAEKASARLASQPDRFGCIGTVLGERIKQLDLTHPNLLSFYQRFYNNVCEIDASKSKWFVGDKAMSQIELNLAARQGFARSYFLRDFGIEGCKLSDLHMDRCLAKQSWSEFKYYCPVTWKNEKLLAQCSENIEDCVLFNNMFYYFRDTKARDMFLTNPLRFLQNSSFPAQTDLPLRLQPHKAAEVVSADKSLSNHCPVSLTDEERIVKGDPLLLIFFRDGKYVFDTEYKLQRFLANPFKYAKVSLPVKMPPTLDKVSLHSLQRMEDSISFMEQALGQIVTRALREVSENRLKYPTISIKETMLKMFSLFLKTENPANTDYMKKKYGEKLKQFVERCEISEELYDLYQEKSKKKEKGAWPEFKENYYNQIGAEFDKTLKVVDQEKHESFVNYIR